jgi:hypothetical protein
MKVKCVFKFIVPKVYVFHKTVQSFAFAAVRILCGEFVWKDLDWYEVSTVN